MRDYFDRLMGMGRYPDRTIQAVFARDRQYFDQILYKNLKFRHAYAQAFMDWAASLGVDRATRRRLLPARIALGVELTGEDRVTRHFATLRQALAAASSSTPSLPPGISYAETLPGGPYDLDPVWAEPMARVRLFWTRLAVPEVWEEEI